MAQFRTGEQQQLRKQVVAAPGEPSGAAVASDNTASARAPLTARFRNAVSCP
ncbi:hypothetical protein [Streptomyces sp. NPDC088707]|uniref:hypothetical protein n=1 Tax=Streptomyces sp. NPDC088707 TaxID=3365871 RepID=UPI00382F0711